MTTPLSAALANRYSRMDGADQPPAHLYDIEDTNPLHLGGFVGVVGGGVAHQRSDLTLSATNW